jgi:hypothetical protein
VIEFKAEDLDVNNGFDCVQVAVPDTGAAGAQLLGALRPARRALRRRGPAVGDRRLR